MAVAFGSAGGPGRADPPAAYVPPDLLLPTVPEDGFLGLRRALRARLADGGDGARRARSDLVALDLSRGFVREAASAAVTLDPGPRARGRTRIARLRAAAWAASAVRPPGPRPAALDDGSPWRQRALFRTLAAHRDGTGDGDLDRAVAEVARLPPHLRAHVAALMAEAILDADRLDLATALSPSLADPAAQWVLRGALAARRGDADAAALAYGHVVEDRSAWGHRARVARVDAQVRSGAFAAVEAMDALHAARAVWRDGDDGAVLRRIQVLALRADRPFAALRAAVGEWSGRDGRTEDAARRVVATARLIYAQTPGTEVGRRAEEHARIVALARFVPGFGRLWHLYATDLHAAGAPDSAALEMAEVAEVDRIGADLGLWPQAAPQVRTRWRADRESARRAAGRDRQEPGSGNGEPTGRASVAPARMSRPSVAAGPLDAARIEAALERATSTLDRLGARGGSGEFER